MSTELEAAIERMKADYQVAVETPGTLYGEFHLSDVQRVLAAVDAAANATDPDVQRRFVRVLDMMEKHRIELVAARQSAPVTTEEVTEAIAIIDSAFDAAYESGTGYYTNNNGFARGYRHAFRTIKRAFLTRKPTEAEKL